MLPNVPLRERRKDFMTDQGRLARACHAYSEMDFSIRAGTSLRQQVRVDTCAPFSVVPYSVWAGHDVSWQPLGSQFLTPQGQVKSDALKWLGIPCQFGETKVFLVDEGERRTRPLRLVAKFPQRPVAPHMENVILAGYNFLTDNALKLTLDPATRLTVGPWPDVVGFLTVP